MSGIRLDAERNSLKYLEILVGSVIEMYVGPGAGCSHYRTFALAAWFSCALHNLEVVTSAHLQK